MTRVPVTFSASRTDEARLAPYFSPSSSVVVVSRGVPESVFCSEEGSRAARMRWLADARSGCDCSVDGESVGEK